MGMDAAQGRLGAGLQPSELHSGLLVLSPQCWGVSGVMGMCHSHGEAGEVCSASREARVLDPRVRHSRRNQEAKARRERPPLPARPWSSAGVLALAAELSGSRGSSGGSVLSRGLRLSLSSSLHSEQLGPSWAQRPCPGPPQKAGQVAHPLLPRTTLDHRHQVLRTGQE